MKAYPDCINSFHEMYLFAWFNYVVALNKTYFSHPKRLAIIGIIVFLSGDRLD